MTVERYVSNLMFSNMYVLKDRDHAVVIDPFEHMDVVEDAIPDLILLTHEHYDHISGVNAWKARFHMPVMCSAACAEALESDKRNMARYFTAFSQMQNYGEQDPNVPIDEHYVCRADLTFEKEIHFSWQGNRISMFELPGHSKGSIGILANDKYFFSGDSLLPDREIELRFPGGNRKLWETVSLPKLKALSDELTVYPGHRGAFSMKDRRQNGIISDTGR